MFAGTLKACLMAWKGSKNRSWSKSNPQRRRSQAFWACDKHAEIHMAKAKYLMIASMDVDPEHEAIFNEVYDREHVPNLSKVPGVYGITRYKRGTLIMNIG